MLPIESAIPASIIRALQLDDGSVRAVYGLRHVYGECYSAEFSGWVELVDDALGYCDLDDPEANVENDPEAVEWLQGFFEFMRKRALLLSQHTRDAGADETNNC
jgi:hypothetical protein